MSIETQQVVSFILVMILCMFYGMAKSRTVEAVLFTCMIAAGMWHDVAKKAEISAIRAECGSAK